MTRAKFTCVEVAKRKHWDSAKGYIYSAKLEPVVSGSPENSAFYAATPGGSMHLDTLSGEHFIVGQTYYVDFSPAAAMTSEIKRRADIAPAPLDPSRLPEG